jgi:hypothetical protein
MISEVIYEIISEIISKGFNDGMEFWLTWILRYWSSWGSGCWVLIFLTLVLINS